MGFARSWDDLRSKMGKSGSIELERKDRTVGKKGAVYSAFQFPDEFKDQRFIITRMRFGAMWGLAEYHHIRETNSIIVVGDYKKIGVLYQSL